MVAQTTDEILRELDQTPNGPVEFEDFRTQTRYVVIARDDYERMRPPPSHGSQKAAMPPEDWSEDKNSRRYDLIDKKIAETLTAAEAEELEVLQAEMLRYRQRVAPLPLEDARKLHQELLAKAAAAQKG